MEIERNLQEVTIIGISVLIEIMLLYVLQSPAITTIEKRPSATCKTPYVADITVENQHYYAHTPALGCCGLSDKGSSVVISPVEKSTNKCAYAVYLSLLYEKDHTFVIGIHPEEKPNFMNYYAMHRCKYLAMTFRFSN